jgi:hypothetical protein
MSTQPIQLSDHFWVKLRNGSYAKIEKYIESQARYKGTIYNDEGRQAIRTYWDINYNSLVDKKFDVVKVKTQGYSGTEINPKNREEWPLWTNTI